MQLSDFDYRLPKELIAQAPARPRDHARLLVYDRLSGHITDDFFYNLDKYLVPGSSLVLNDSKVEKTRLRIGNVEIFVVETVNPSTVRARVRPGKKFQLGSQISLPLKSGKLEVRTLDIDNEGIRTLQLGLPVGSPKLDDFRLTPFPPYIAQDESLAAEYQTVYARPLGSRAAPTAGLHFTAAQLAKLSTTHPVVKLTLHVDLGTFAPVKNQDITSHKLHSEEFFVSAQAAKALNQAKHVTAVGTTSLRTLESLKRPFKKTAGATDIFITPGYKFKNVDSLITNFHLPKTTLLMLVAAFVGSGAELHRIYQHAIDKKYRFYSFGDAMLVI